MTNKSPASLADFRRTVATSYLAVRASMSNDPAAAWRMWRMVRDGLNRNHPQTPLDADQLAAFTELPFYPYDAAFSVIGRISPSDPRSFTIPLRDDGDLSLTAFATCAFTIKEQPLELTLYWINGYGGGVFLPFGDLTNNDTTFGGGRYLYDTIKGADLGIGERDILLDFNYAYNPSCAYNVQWVCPLSPPENKLAFEIAAGELLK